MASVLQRLIVVIVLLLQLFICFTTSSKDKTLNDSKQPLDINEEILEMKKKMITKSILEKTGLDKSRRSGDGAIKRLPDGILEKFFTDTENDTISRENSKEETKKIMLRTKKVTDFDCKDCFRVSRENKGDQGSSVKAEVWVYQDPTIAITKKTNVKVYVIDEVTKKKTLLGRSRLRQKPSGWHSIKLNDVTKFTSSNKNFKLILQFMCNKCKLDLMGGNTPIFELSEKIVIQKPQTNKFSKRCTKDSKGCCLADFEIDFNDLAGPLQSILLPKKVNVGICQGSCNDAHAALDVHGSILRSTTLKEASASNDLCCVPKIYKPFSTLIYNNQGDIVVRNVNDLIVDGCGCA